MNRCLKKKRKSIRISLVMFFEKNNNLVKLENNFSLKTVFVKMLQVKCQKSFIIFYREINDYFKEKMILLETI